MVPATYSVVPTSCSGWESGFNVVMDYLLGVVNDVGKLANPRRRTHSAHGETRNGERRTQGGGWSKTQLAQGVYSAETRTLEAAMREN